MRGIAAGALAAFCLLGAAAPALAGPRGCVLGKYGGDLHVTMVGSRPIVAATINGRPAHLFIDTGSFWGVLSPAAAKRLGLRVRYGPQAMTVSGVTGQSQVGVASVDQFALGEIYKSRDVDFLVAEHGLGGGDGILGQNLLGGADVEYDLANGVVRLFRAQGCQDADLGYWAPGGSDEMAIDPMQPPSNRIRGKALLNGVAINVMFDTGTPRSMLTLRAARRAGIQLTGPGVTALGAAGGLGRRLTETWLAPFKSFRIGDETITGTRLRIADIDLGDTDMLVGADFFLSHRIYVAKSQSRLYFTYNGGPVFDLEHVAAAPAPPQTPLSDTAGANDTPHDAAGFVRRADAYVTREEFGRAIADYTSAIALQPNNAGLYADRGFAYLRDRQPAPAMADFDRTIQMHPNAPRTLVARGELRLTAHDTAGAEADFDQALKLTPNVAAAVGAAYVQAGLFQRAVAVYDGLLSGKPPSEDTAWALFARCRARAYWGQELDRALADCAQAMKLRPGATDYLQVRGLIYLREGRLDRALADYDAALKKDPHDAWSLYGRGRAEVEQGNKAKGDADIAAAVALDPKLPAQLKTMGLAA